MHDGLAAAGFCVDNDNDYQYLSDGMEWVQQPARAVEHAVRGNGRTSWRLRLPSCGLLILVVAMHGLLLAVLVDSGPAVPVTPPLPLLTGDLLPVPEPAATPARPAEPLSEPVRPAPILQSAASPPATVTRMPAAPDPAPAAPAATAVDNGAEAAARPSSADAAAPSSPATPVAAPMSAPAVAAAGADDVIEPRQDASGQGNPPPVYPALSRRFGEQGSVQLDILILASGRVGAVRVATSSGFARLDAAAVAAVKQWLYQPARRGGVAIDFRYLQPVRFSLDAPN